MLRAYRLQNDRPLVGLLSMLIEDTVHSTVEEAPLINAALGITIRSAGLTRAHGGMWGFWQNFRAHYQRLGGTLRTGCPVRQIKGREGGFVLETRQGFFPARQVVSAVPVELTARLAPQVLGQRLKRFLRRDVPCRGGAIVVCLGVPEHEVNNQEFTHHQILRQYEAPLGNGNNMFLSVSAADDRKSAPAGFRTAMISTHCNLDDWRDLSEEDYQRRKQAAGDQLIRFARRVYPQLGMNPKVYEIGTPRTYERFTHRPDGEVGGVRQTLANSNQHAVPHEIGIPGFWLAGDTTWPGLGTVACVLGSRIVAQGVIERARRYHRVSHADCPKEGGLSDALFSTV